MDSLKPRWGPEVIAIVVALGIGLLIGLERERRKGEGPGRSPAGLRTFAAASLAGATSVMIGGKGLLALVTAGIVVLTAIAYLRSRSDFGGGHVVLPLLREAFVAPGWLSDRLPRRLRRRPGGAGPALHLRGLPRHGGVSGAARALRRGARPRWHLPARDPGPARRPAVLGLVPEARRRPGHDARRQCRSGRRARCCAVRSC
ncbi:hypothetical protein ABIF63_008557 [Bradyrhizobium japonicum]|uniref:MgtC/SapB/SrpB/YhiD N-terminal domain-containing protein n=1 Tax=Bradyrhizobium japonicum TaxID=375 RepID=A0ABV2S5I5_BRAJP